MNSPSSISPIWRLELLGGLRAHRLGVPDEAPLEKFRTQKTASLLAYLALKRKMHRRELLGEIFWPESEPESARNSLRVSLSALRTLLEPPGVETGSVLQISREGVTLGSGAITDVEIFLNAWNRAGQAPNTSQQRHYLEEAFAAYSGPLLRGHYNEWLVGEDGRLEDIYLEAASTLIRILEVEEQTKALEVARRAVEAAPLREEALLNLLRLGLKIGQNGHVIREFEAWQKRAVRQNVSVSAETLELFEHAKKPERRLDASQSDLQTPVSTTVPQQVQTVPVPRALGRSLPGQWTAFFGRETELVSLRSWLEEPGTRLVTVTGPGGGGKTRLALELGRRLKAHPEIEDSEGASAQFSLVEWVPLADLREAHLIPSAILKAMGQPRNEESLEMVLDSLRQILKDAPQSRMLLIFDNFEHLYKEGAPLIWELLDQVPELVCLVTSRRRLGFGGEREWPLQPLATPRIEIGETDGDSVPASVQLFLDRARLARPDFKLTADNRDDIAQLCARLDGLPLAVELAAARVTLFSPSEILAELNRQLEKYPVESSGTAGSASLDWTNLDRAAPSRHRSLRAAIAWSQRQLPPPVAKFWARLSVFRGGWTLEAATFVCEEPDAPPLMLALRDVSLISLDRRGDTPRGNQLEVLRECAAEGLNADDREMLATRHARYFLNWAENVAPHLTGPRAPRFLALFEAERDNLRAALDWHLQHDVEGALRFVSALWWAWEVRGHLSEGLVALSNTLKAAQQAYPDIEDQAREGLPGAKRRLLLLARTLNGAGKLAMVSVDLNIAQQNLEKSLDYYRLLDDQEGIADCLYSLGYMYLKRANLDKARQLCDESIAIYRALGEESAVSDALFNRALVALYDGDFEKVKDLNDERLVIHREAGEARGVAISLENLGLVALFNDEIDAAKAYLTEALALFQSIDELRSQVRVYWCLGHAARATAQEQEAIEAFSRALRLANETQTLWTMPYIIEAFAYIATDNGDMARATRLLGGASILRETHSEPLPNLMFLQEFDAVVAKLRDSLGTALFDSEWQLGRTLSRETLVALALTGNQPAP